MLRYIPVFLLLFALSACDTNIESTATERPTAPIIKFNRVETTALAPVAEALPPVAELLPQEPVNLLNEPTRVHRFESTAEALSVWRQFVDQRPTLLLLSNNPHLKPTPEEFSKQISILINNANAKSLALVATDRNPAPLMLPGMAIDAALQHGWFQELAWALPLRDPAQELSLEKFREQFAASGIAQEEETASLALTERSVHGVLRNTAFSAAALPLLQDLPQPVIVHIDLGYFQPIYKNEISTPLFDIILNTLKTLKKMQLQTLAVTFSYGHLDSQIALDVRFLGDILVYLIEDPTRLDQPIPINWQRQRDALYLANFFQKEKVQELYQAQEQDAPEAAWVQFNLYGAAAENKQGGKALDYLAQAVGLDPMFAIEYLELSTLAYERKRPDEAFRMLTLASEAFPNDPFIKLQMVQLAQELGDKEAALHLLAQLRNLQWSEFYYPQMDEYLTGLTEFVQNGEVPAQATAEQSAEGEAPASPEKTSEPARQRILNTQNRH